MKNPERNAGIVRPMNTCKEIAHGRTKTCTGETPGTKEGGEVTKAPTGEAIRGTTKLTFQTLGTMTLLPAPKMIATPGQKN